MIVPSSRLVVKENTLDHSWMSSKGVIPSLRPDIKKTPLNEEEILKLKYEAQERRQLLAANSFTPKKVLPAIRILNDDMNKNLLKQQSTYNLIDDSHCHSFSETTPTPPSDILSTPKSKTQLLESYTNFKSVVLQKKQKETDYYPYLGLDIPSKNSTIKSLPELHLMPKISSNSSSTVLLPKNVGKISPSNLQNIVKTCHDKMDMPVSTQHNSMTVYNDSMRVATNEANVVQSIDIVNSTATDGDIQLSTTDNVKNESLLQMKEHSVCNEVKHNDFILTGESENSPNNFNILQNNKNFIESNTDNIDDFIMATPLNVLSPVHDALIGGKWLNGEKFLENNSAATQPNVSTFIKSNDIDFKSTEDTGTNDLKNVDSQPVDLLPISLSNITNKNNKNSTPCKMDGNKSYVACDTENTVKELHSHGPTDTQLINCSFETIENNPLEVNLLFSNNQVDQLDTNSKMTNITMEDLLNSATPVSDKELEQALNFFGAQNAENINIDNHDQLTSTIIADPSTTTTVTQCGVSSAFVSSIEDDKNVDITCYNNTTSDLLNDCFSMVMSESPPRKSYTPKSNLIASKQLSQNMAINAAHPIGNKIRAGSSNNKTKRSGSSKGNGRKAQSTRSMRSYAPPAPTPPPPPVSALLHSKTVDINPLPPTISAQANNTINQVLSCASIPSSYNGVIPTPGTCYSNNVAQPRQILLSDDMSSTAISTNNNANLNQSTSYENFNINDNSFVQRLLSQGLLTEQLRCLADSNILSSLSINNGSNNINNNSNNDNQIVLTNIVRNTAASNNIINDIIHLFKNDQNGQYIQLRSGLNVLATDENQQLYNYLKQLVVVIVNKHQNGILQISEIKNLISVLDNQLNTPHLSIDNDKIVIYSHILGILTTYCNSFEVDDCNKLISDANQHQLLLNQSSSTAKAINSMGRIDCPLDINTNNTLNYSATHGNPTFYDASNNAAITANNVNTTNGMLYVGSNNIDSKNAQYYIQNNAATSTQQHATQNYIIPNHKLCGISDNSTATIIANDSSQNFYNNNNVNNGQLQNQLNQYAISSHILNQQMATIQKVMQQSVHNGENDQNTILTIPNHVNNDNEYSMKNFSSSQISKQPQELPYTTGVNHYPQKQQGVQRLINVPSHITTTTFNNNNNNNINPVPSQNSVTLANNVSTHNQYSASQPLLTCTNDNNNTMVNSNGQQIPSKLLYHNNNNISNVNEFYQRYIQQQQFKANNNTIANSNMTSLAQNYQNNQQHPLCSITTKNEIVEIPDNRNGGRNNKIYIIPTTSINTNNSSSNNNTMNNNCMISFQSNSFNGPTCTNTSTSSIPSSTQQYYCNNKNTILLPNNKNNNDNNQYKIDQQQQTLNSNHDYCKVAYNLNSEVDKELLNRINMNKYDHHYNHHPSILKSNISTMNNSNYQNFNNNPSYQITTQLPTNSSDNHPSSSAQTYMLGSAANQSSSIIQSKHNQLYAIFGGLSVPFDSDCPINNIPSAVWHNIHNQIEYHTRKKLENPEFLDGGFVSYLTSLKTKLEVFVNESVTLFNESSEMFPQILSHPQNQLICLNIFLSRVSIGFYEMPINMLDRFLALVLIISIDLLICTIYNNDYLQVHNLFVECETYLNTLIKLSSEKNHNPFFEAFYNHIFLKVKCLLQKRICENKIVIYKAVNNTSQAENDQELFKQTKYYCDIASQYWTQAITYGMATKIQTDFINHFLPKMEISSSLVSISYYLYIVVFMCLYHSK